MKTNHVAKLFGVLVLGGSMIAGAHNEEEATTDAHCQVKLVVEKQGSAFPKQTTCLDEKSDEEVLDLVAEGKEPVETPPICSSWGF